MRALRVLASWRWCLLAVLSVGCAHTGASTPASEPRASESSATRSAGPDSPERKERKVRELMALSGAEETGKQMLVTMTSHFEQMPSVPPGFVEKFLQLAAEESLVDMLVPVYMRHFTEEDLDAAIAFHESPAGRRFIAAQPLVLQESMKLGEQWGVQLAEKALRALAEEQRELQRRPVRHEGQQL
ncbi:DUF2059 domain-containing protein [Archangium sp.]|uniref:DUF2059 domain-containing protein n=1 Tax=Archangium sp. TaxID=1872627 RepID=UPI00286B7A37|nr:DUF2059 domain-containing protein [Archangium sp.]